MDVLTSASKYGVCFQKVISCSVLAGYSLNDRGVEIADFAF